MQQAEILPITKKTFEDRTSYNEINQIPKNSTNTIYFSPNPSLSLCLSRIDAFIYFGVKNATQQSHNIQEILAQANRQTQSANVGWKLHISFDDNSKENAQKAWNIIKKLAIKHTLPECKIIAKEWNLNTPEMQEQQGKQIVIYIGKNSFLQIWKPIITDIERSFQQAGILQGTQPPHNAKIFGSTYISYRNDANYDALDRYNQPTYLSTETSVIKAELKKTDRHNPFNLPNPFKNIQITLQSPHTILQFEQPKPTM